jgi:hypothetical protein
MQGAVLLLLAAAPLANLATAGDGSNVLDVSDVDAWHEALDGQTVQVRGWISVCHVLSCGLAAKPDGRGTFVSLGQSPDFDRDPQFQDRTSIKEVIVEAVVSRRCFAHGGEAGVMIPPPPPCMDRSDQLRSPKLLRVVRKLPFSAKRKP